MIDYSVYMMRNPLKPEQPEKAYARAQVNEIWTIGRFARHIADHNGVYSRGTVKGVLSDSCECLVEQLLCGNKIVSGDLGTFSISLSSTGAATIKEFTAKNIKAVNILFAPGDDFENLIDRAEFNPVASRAAQTATLKAEKAGLDTVDLAAAKTGTGSSTGGSGSGDSGEGGENPLG